MTNEELRVLFERTSALRTDCHDPSKATRNKIHPCEIEQLLGHKQCGGFICMEHAPMMKKALVSGNVCKAMRAALGKASHIADKAKQYHQATGAAYCPNDFRETFMALPIGQSGTKKKPVMPMLKRKCGCCKGHHKKEQQQATPLPPSPCEAPNAPTPGGSAALDFSSRTGGTSSETNTCGKKSTRTSSSVRLSPQLTFLRPTRWRGMMAS
jgi:hypothetical protein